MPLISLRLVTAFGLLLTATCAAATPPKISTPYSDIVIFGDSLSDAGNRWIQTSHREPVSPPYAAGRFSNGRVWVQDLAVALGFNQPGPSLLGGNDFAEGGAYSGTSAAHTAVPGDLPSQFAAFSAARGSAPASVLFTLEIGANDLFAAVDSGIGAQAGLAVMTQAANNTSGFVAALVGLGARRVMVLGLTDLGKTPRMLELGVAGRALSATLANQYNAVLAPSLAAIAAATGARITLVNTFSWMGQIVANPAAQGFTNVTGSCWSGDTTSATSGVVCSRALPVQDQFLFWDDGHPTEHGHSSLAALALTQLP